MCSCGIGGLFSLVFMLMVEWMIGRLYVIVVFDVLMMLLISSW